ncbi:putative kinesin [Ilyonectria robusta]
MDNRRGRITTATVGTNHWIWQNPSYLGWQDETSSVIWIAGKPGSGKSVLAKTIQEQLLTTSGSARSLIAAWFYSARDNLVLHQQMFSALMKQLLSQEPSLFEYVKDVYRSLLQRYMTYREISWPVASLERGMESMLPNLAKKGASCLFIVDGLDESNSADAGQDCSRADALDFLVHLTTQGLPLKIIFLSRFSNDINRCLRNQHYISMHDVNRPDIVFLIERGVEDLSRKLDGDESDVDDDYSPMITPTMSTSSSFISDPATRKRQVSFFQEYSKQVSSEKESMILDIKAYLRANANGVVLWVVTVMDILRRKCEEPFCDLKSLKAQLESLPLELTELYSRIAVLLLQNFKGSRSTLEKSRRILMWVSVSSQYNFQLQDLLEVISSDLSSDEAVERPHVLAGRTGWASVRRQIEKLCAAFVEVIPALPRTYDAADSEPTQWDILQLAHESVRTFLQHDENSLGLGFSQSEAERVVRQERRNYMRRTLPRLEPIFHLPTFQPSTGTGIEQELCSYIEIRPVLCFILSTLEFELQHIMSRPNGQDRVVNIVNECKPKNKQEMESRPVRLPFSPASALLAACDFLQLSKPKNPQLSLADVAYFVDNATFLGQLFFVACAGGQLNAANVLSLLLISPTAGMPEEIIIMDAMRRAAREEELLQEVRFLRSGRDCVYCCPNETRGRIRKPDRAAAAISQVYRHLKFEGTSVRFRSLDGGNADYSLWTESPHWYRKLHALSKDKGNYHRTPFTRLFWTGPNGGFLLRFEGDNDISQWV